VTRDRLMLALARRYPQYRWERNVGYGTPEHWTSVNEHGLSPHHRRTFIHPRQLVLDLDGPVDLVDLALLPSLEELVNDAMLPTPIVVRGNLRFEPSEAPDSPSPEAQ
jgi:hypothetical protein